MVSRSARLTLAFALLLILAACSRAEATPTPATGTEIAPVVLDTGVIAEGRLVPAKYVDLAFTGSGKVSKLLKQEGDSVEAGDIIAQLEGLAALQAGVAAAQQEQILAKQALEDTQQQAGLVSAQKQLELANARDALDDAEYKWRVNQEGYRGSKNTMDAARARLVLADDYVEAAERAYHSAPGNDDDATKATALANLAAARKSLDDVKRQWTWLNGKPSAIDQAILDAELAEAQAALAEAQREYDKVKDGVDTDSLAAAQARFDNAEASLAAAQEAVNQLQIVAPFSGKLSRLDLKVGEMITSAVVVATVTDSSSWIVETDDLTEIEVVRVQPGQKVTLVADALPDLEMTGTVETIAEVFEEKRGDVTYTAKLRVDDVDPRLRWGMTVVATFGD
jgi:HlyD family secretion protein